jgi:hypothetical protein
MTPETTLPLEHFIQAVQSQLDNAQMAMGMKARNLNLPLTFAIKDISLDLRAHVEFARSEIRIRPASASDKEASVFHLVFTAITRPMIEENAVAFSDESHEESLDSLKDELSDDDRKRLEWSGVRTVAKLRELQARGADRTVERVTGLPAERLRQALARTSAPLVADVSPAPDTDNPATDLPARIRLRGRNLARNGPPRVLIGGQAVSVLSADDREVIIAPKPHQLSGQLTISTSPELSSSTAFDLRPFWPARETPGSGGDGGGQ